MYKKIKIDEKSLSKKYQTNVSSLIHLWQKGNSDLDICHLTGIPPYTLQQIKGDIELAHRRLRMARKKELLGEAYQHHIFFNPLT